MLNGSRLLAVAQWLRVRRGPRWGEARGADRVHPGRRADGRGPGQAARDRGRGNGRRPARLQRIPDGREDAGQQADRTAEQGQRHRLDKELIADLAAGGAERPPQPDLPPPFEYRDDHGVGDADAADEQRDPGQAEEQRGERVLRVDLRCQRAGSEFVVEVADTGTGISPEDLPRIFDRFWRADKSRSRRTGGSGLGLPITRQLVEAHGDHVTATSVPGSGSVFTIQLSAGNHSHHASSR
jgi:Histidine kinase-, DNA gyrase B-, and HSP90-like ATPase